MTSAAEDRGTTSHISAAIRTGSLREQVSRALEAALVAGELQPGEIYSAPGLAERFGVSATPVREALLDLVRDGFVEVVRNRGFRVVEMSETDLDQIFAIRSLLEVSTTAEVADVITADRLERLDTLAAAIQAAAVSGDLIGYLDADRRFHGELIGALDNPRLTELIDRLRRQTRLFGLDELVRSDRLRTSAHEHLELLDALRAHDSDAARDIMSAHIRHTRGVWVGREESDRR
jgi:DNA-binding GntR family transcriptional regulator